MDKDRIDASAKQVRGAVKRAVGDAKLRADGRADVIKGKVRNAIGSLKDDLRDTK
jgi:uncharacterized protein YjbJ (UPF0337 family)